MAAGTRRASLEPAPADRDARRHRARLGRAAAAARPHLPVALRFAQPLPGQCRGGPASLGDGLSAARLFRPRRPRGGRGVADAPFGRPRQAAHPRHLQRADRRLAQLFHVHLFHRPRRPVSAEEPGRERLRPAVAQLPVHADRRSLSHVRRHERHHPGHQAHARGDEERCAATTRQRSATPARSICRPCSATSISGSARRSTCSAPRFRPMPRAISRPASRAARTRRGSRITAASAGCASICPTERAGSSRKRCRCAPP